MNADEAGEMVMSQLRQVSAKFDEDTTEEARLKVATLAVRVCESNRTTTVQHVHQVKSGEAAGLGTLAELGGEA